MAKESLKKITATAKKTAEYLRQTAELVSQVRAIAVEIDPEAADAPAADLPSIIAAGLRERLMAAEQAAAAATEAVGGKADKSEALAAVNLGITRTPSSVAFAPTGLRVDASVRPPSPTVLSAATLTAAGVMSAADKAALDSAGESIKMMFELLQAKMTAQEIIGVIGPERYRELRPDVVAVVEPADGKVIAYRWLDDDTKKYQTISAKDGVITTADLEEKDDGDNIVFYDCTAVHYLNCAHCMRFAGPLKVWISGAGEPAPKNKLALMEGIVGWSHLSDTSFSWWTEPWSGGFYFADEVELRGVWDMSSSIKMDNGFSFCDDDSPMMILPEEVLVSANTINRAGVDYPFDWFFTAVKTYRFPTLDLSGVNADFMHLNSVHTAWTTLKWLEWQPERPQKWLIKGLGNCRSRYGIELDGIIDWDRDDMMASLVTYYEEKPGRKSSVMLSQPTFDKISDEDAAAISEHFTLVRTDLKMKWYEGPETETTE